MELRTQKWKSIGFCAMQVRLLGQASGQAGILKTQDRWMSAIYMIVEAGLNPSQFRELCLSNDWSALELFQKRLRDGTRVVANSLRGDGFAIVNCSAGNVTGRAETCSRDADGLRDDVISLLGHDVPVRIGIGSSLRDAYVAAFGEDNVSAGSATEVL
jgi:hypothetical protein